MLACHVPVDCGHAVAFLSWRAASIAARSFSGLLMISLLTLLGLCCFDGNYISKYNFETTNKYRVIDYCFLRHPLPLDRVDVGRSAHQVLARVSLDEDHFNHVLEEILQLFSRQR